MYRFIRCQPHPRCPDLQGWYLVLKPDDWESLMDLHKGMAGLYYAKFGPDTPLVKSAYMGPLGLAALWLQSVEKLLGAGTTIAVNSCGGILLLKGLTILAELESKKMVWPDTYPGEIITISKWPEGRHYYLSSNQDRVFVPSKYVQYKDAKEAASRYTDQIRDKVL